MDAKGFVLAHTAVTAPPVVPELRLRLAELITPLWEALEAWAGRACEPPFWAFAWAGGQALARFLLDHPERVRERPVLDFGSGSGLTGIAAARAGAAHVLAADIDPLAAAACRINAQLNGVALETTGEDWIGRAVPADWVVLAGDMLYEGPLARRALPWLTRCAGAGATVLLGEPGRNYAPGGGFVELARYGVPTTVELEGRTSREARVLLLAPEG